MKSIFITLLFFYINSLLIAQLSITDITATNLIGDASNGGLYGGHGVMFGDSDGDGDADLYITMNSNSGTTFNAMSDQYFENENGVFREKGLARGISNYDSKGSHGWLWADLDNDGDYDGWNGSYTKNIPYKNKNDQPGYFEDVFTTSGIEDISLGTRGVAAFDYDNDGDLDLFGNNWYARSTIEDNEFYRNNGNFTFTRIDNGLTKAKGDQGVCDGDFDNDGDMDIMLSVFEGNVDGRCVEIWENVNGEFERLTNSGLTLCGASYDGVTFWDMNNDGWLDVVSEDKIFINNGDKTFTLVKTFPEGTSGFMKGIADMNNDGYWDIVTPGGLVYINNGDLTFSSLSYITNGTINDPRCVSFSDIDGDGDVDFALGQKATYNRLYRNDYGGVNRYLFVKLKTADNQIGAFGAKVYIYSAVGDTLLGYRQAHSNQGYLSQDDPTLHFGCGNREQVKVKVVFLNNSTYEFISGTNKTVLFPASITIKVFLAGNYNSNNMNTSLQHLIPLTQPYNIEPWSYFGEEITTTSIITNNDIVDWVLVELKTTDLESLNIISVRKAALLRSDGYLIDSNGFESINFYGINSGDYYTLVKHRNHLAIQSTIPIEIKK